MKKISGENPGIESGKKIRLAPEEITGGNGVGFSEANFR